MRTGGIVLAAGASSRMGRPKALLETARGVPLAAHQAGLLRGAGCARACIVLGADADRIAPALAGYPIAVNPDWARGRFTSVQAGLRALPGLDGYLILPVDSAGVRPETVSALLRHVHARAPAACRPRVSGRPGRMLWIRADTAAALLAEAAGDVHLRRQLAGRTEPFDVADPAILNNVNTPEDWTAIRPLIPEADPEVPIGGNDE